MANRIVYILLLCCFLAQLIAVGANSYEEDTTITLDEAEALEKFRGLVKRIKLPHAYMEESIFLVKFLRAQNYDVNAAVVQLLKHLEWRDENRIDQLDDEDWTDFKKDYPWNIDGVDKEGRPVVQIIFKEWNTAKAMENGQEERLTRWGYKYMEDVTKRVRSLQKEGKKVTRFSIIGNAEDYNAVEQGCPKCMSMYFAYCKAIELQFPGSLEKLYYVNSSQYVIENLIKKLWKALSKDMQKAIKYYGTDSKVWRKALSEVIDDDQLLPANGGTMKAV